MVLYIKVGDVINDEKILVGMFNNHYVKIVENSTGFAPTELCILLHPNLDWDTVEKILKHYENHSSLKELRN